MEFVCQFDHHMRNHTKFGQQIAIIAMKAKVERESWGHLDQFDYVNVETELMKIDGVAAVLTVFGKDELKYHGLLQTNSDGMNLGAAMLLKPGTDIHDKFAKKIQELDLIENYEVLVAQTYFSESYPDYDMYEGMWVPDRKRNRKYEKLIFFNGFSRDDSLWERNRALLENRCSLSYPDDSYKSYLEHSHLADRKLFADYPRTYKSIQYKKEVLKYLWNLVKNSKLCCCVSQYFCTSSTTLEKCQQGCCGKCTSESTENESTENDTSCFDSESDTNSEVEIESDGDSSSRSDIDPEPDIFSDLSS